MFHVFETGRTAPQPCWSSTPFKFFDTHHHHHHPLLILSYSSQHLQVLPTPAPAPTPVQIQTLSRARNKDKVESTRPVMWQRGAFMLKLTGWCDLCFIDCVILSTSSRPPSIDGGGDPVRRVGWRRQQFGGGDAHQDQPPQPRLSVRLPLKMSQASTKNTAYYGLFTAKKWLQNCRVVFLHFQKLVEIPFVTFLKEPL